MIIRLFTNIIFFLLILLTLNLQAKETWILDKELSTINFEIPVFLTENVKGTFKKIDGVVEIDTENKKNNKAIFSVNISSIQINYKKYKTLLLSDIFFDIKKFPLALVDTKKFSYENQNKLNLDVELQIKGKSQNVPLQLEIKQLAEELIQIKGKLFFSRNFYNIGTGKWSSTKILKDKGMITTNLFLFKK